MPTCKCFMALGRCPIDELKARVAALEGWLHYWSLDSEPGQGGPEPAEQAAAPAQQPQKRWCKECRFWEVDELEQPCFGCRRTYGHEDRWQPREGGGA